MVYASKRNRRSCCYVPAKDTKFDVWAWFDNHPFASLCAKCAITAATVWAFFTVYFLT